MGSGCLHLLAPGLFGPFPPTERSLIAAELAQRPRPRHLERLLNRAARCPAAVESASGLLATFGLAPPPDGDWPSAPFCHLTDEPEGEQGGYWLHADPVHLRPDRDRVRLFDAQALAITAAEAAELTALFNRHFDTDTANGVGPHLSAPQPSRWYVRLATPPALRTTPLAVVNGQSIEPYLPTGEAAKEWAARLTETQMLFHGAAVNQRREAARQPTINALWPWGGGSLPPPPATRPFATVVASTPLAIGLARWSGAALYKATEGVPLLRSLPMEGDGLVEWALPSPAQDVPGWIGAVQALDAWLADLPAVLRAGTLEALVLDPGPDLGTPLRLDRRAARPVWRRRRPFTHWLAGSAEGGISF